MGETALVLGQHRRRLTGIETAIERDTGPTWGIISWVGLHRVYVCRDMRQPDSLAIQVLNRCWPALAMVGIIVEDIFQLVSLVLTLLYPGHLEFQHMS